MAKPKLDLQIIHDLQPQTLQPLDFMSPMELPEVPTVPNREVAPPTSTKKPKRDTKPAEPDTPPRVRNSDPAELPMPPARQVEARAAFTARVRLDTNERLRTFIRDHDVTMQDTVELAIDEFLKRRSE